MTRREAFKAAGVGALGGNPSLHERRLIDALAAMLDVALNRNRPKQRTKPDLTKLPYGPGQVFEALEKNCADIIQLRPYETSSFGRLGKNLAGISGLELADMDRVTSWIQSGGLSSWPCQVTWSHVIRHYANWVSLARAWEARGGTAVQGPVGADDWR